jgi:phytanoyl-CoA hydroxylase
MAQLYAPHMTTTEEHGVEVGAGDDELARRFVDEGYVVVPGLVAPPDVERAREEIPKFATGEYPVRNLPPDGRILAVHFPHWVSPVVLDLVRHPGVSGVLARITGAHLAHWDGRVKCMQSMLFMKPPGLQGQAWHQDERYIPTRDRSLVGAWIALDDATIENGCLWVIPGSHRHGYLHPTRDHGRPDEFDPSDEAYGFDDSAAVPVEVRAGDVVFFNGYLLHRSLRNRATTSRRALVNHYMNAWSTLPWMTDQGVDVGRIDTRMVVPVVGDDPYAWKGYDEVPSSTFVRPATGSWGDVFEIDITS